MKCEGKAGMCKTDAIYKVKTKREKIHTLLCDDCARHYNEYMREVRGTTLELINAIVPEEVELEKYGRSKVKRYAKK